jgi:hypothetical protein
MCDYSLHAVKTREAVKGDKLEVSMFFGTITQGLKEAGGDCQTAVCLREGTELRFDNPLLEKKQNSLWAFFSTLFTGDNIATHDAGVATFCKIGRDYTHNDALELPNGKKILIHNLVLGQVLTVLTVPVSREAQLAQAIEGVACAIESMLRGEQPVREPDGVQG